MATIAQQIKGTTEEKAKKLKALDSLGETLKTRNLNEVEQIAYDSLITDIEETSTRLRNLEDSEKRALSGAKPFSPTPDQDEANSEDFAFQILKKAKVDRLRPLTDFHLRNYNVDERMQKADVYKVIRALASGKAKDTATAYALSEVRSITGTALLNDYLASQLWDGALPKSRLAQAGLQYLPLQSGTHKFAKIASGGYPVYQWKAEGASTTERSATFENVTFDAKTLRGWLKCSGELLHDGINTEQLLRSVINKSIASGIDTAGLTGAGTDEPTGVLHMSDVNTYSMTGTHGGKLSTWDPLFEVTQLIQSDNADTPTAAIMNPREWKEVNRIMDSVNAWKTAPRVFDSMQILDSTTVPINLTKGASGNCGAIFFGGFDSMYLGTRLDTTIQISPVLSSTYEYEIFTVFRGDFQCEREEALGMITGINPLA